MNRFYYIGTYYKMKFDSSACSDERKRKCQPKFIQIPQKWTNGLKYSQASMLLGQKLPMNFKSFKDKAKIQTMSQAG